MPWIAELIDGPLEDRSFQIDDDLSGEPPASIDVEGHEYIYAGWAGDSPRYRCRALSRILGDNTEL